MDMTNRLEIRQISELRPYDKNARVHSPEQIEKLRASLRAYGFVRPILINGEGMVLAGHGILEAAKAEGLTEAPCVPVEHLSSKEARAYILADNRLAELSAWDQELVTGEIRELETAGLDLTLTGFDAADLDLGGEPAPELPEDGGDESAEYQAFVDKFKPKKTTDDCYTPEPVYNAVRDWAVERYGLRDREILRPFWPGEDYQAAEYGANAVVIDNPPFSILSEIVGWYMDRAVPFFMFAPGLTLFSVAAGRCNYVLSNISIVFENGADICISFVTNLGEYKIETAPELYAAIASAMAEHNAAPDLPSYKYPAEVLLSTSLDVRRAPALQIRADECAFVRALDSQKAAKKALYGGGFLLSERAAAERAAAELRDVVAWPLSDEERALIRGLGHG